MRVVRVATAVAVGGVLATAVVAAHPAPSGVTHATSRATAANDSLVVSTAWLAAHLEDPRVVILHVGHSDASYRKGHIPGARWLSYMDIVTRRDDLGTELPPAEQLRDLFERLGVSDSSRVVVYGDEAPMATRVIFSLDYLGHAHVALLDGGLPQWRAEKRPVTKAEPRITRGTLTPRVHQDIVASAEWILARVGRPGIALIDTRTDGEYLGSGERQGIPSEGHIAGAHQLQWEELFREGKPQLLRDRAELQRLYADRMQAGDTVVTYCWVGYRASATYFIARYLGFPVKMYDGSYQDWWRRKLPVRAGQTP